ncbi:MAG: F0F1 ATP synthase subunit alpha, partial [Lachnospiraceae bacterium]|nr:F0F1 ATP synthase subunit alpha [Lachnospiraceae bacterium]
YIPTNVISITDGQIFLETELFHSGIMPAINPGISVSRVGGAAQIKALKKVAGSLKLLYSQYRELQSFAQFGSDLDQDTKDRLAQGARIVEVLKQKNNAPIPVEDQVCIIYAVVNGYLADIEVEEISAFERGFYGYLHTFGTSISDAIRISKELSPETEENLKEAIEEFKKRFKGGAA